MIPVQTKWNELSPSIKWRILIIFVFIILLVCYKNISTTIITISSYKSLKKTLSNEKNTTTMTKSESNENQFNSSFEQTEHTINSIIDYCEENTIAVTELTQTYTKDADGYVVETDKIKLQSSYLPLLELLQYLEEEKKAAISSVTWKIEKDKQTDEKPQLYATVYLKHLKHEDKNK